MAVATAVVLITFSTISVSEDNLENISEPVATSEAIVSKSVRAVVTGIPDTDISKEPLLTCNQNIPLPDYLQLVMQQACLEYGVSYTLALAVAECESSFDLEADSGTCWGLMQINPVNYARFRELGIEPTQYEGNVVAGVFMLGELLNKYGDTHKALMAYNCGEYGASCLWEQGYITSSYSRKVTNTQDKWQQILNDNQEAIIND